MPDPAAALILLCWAGAIGFAIVGAWGAKPDRAFFIAAAFIAAFGLALALAF